VRKRDSFYMAVIALTPLVLLYDSVLSRSDGVVLLLLYSLYLYRLASQSKEHSKVMRNAHTVSKKQALREVIKFLVGTGLLLGSADLLVRSSTQLAVSLGIPLAIIGLVLVALGTSLPELSFEIEAILHSRGSLVLGNILGSVVVNASLVLGVVALISPITILVDVHYIATVVALTLAILVFSVFLRSRSKVTLSEGLGLVFLYLLFVAVQFGLS